MTQLPSVGPDPAVDMRSARQPLGNKIAHHIRSDILYGRLKPGDHLRQRDLCDQYGTSRMPIRDALRQLTYEGFIKDDGTGHSVVVAFRRRDLEDIWLIEGMLHGLAVRRIVEIGDEEDVKQLERMHEQMLTAEEGGTRDVMAKTNWNFHRMVNRMARSPKLLAVLRTHTLSIPSDYLLELPHWIHTANEQHGEILEAVIRRDADLADELMRSHVTDSGAAFLAFMVDQGVNLD